MDTCTEIRVDNEPHARPFQFTLRTMFIVTTVVALWCGGLFAPYAWARVATLAVWVLSAPVVLLVMVIYARGYMRTFAIGGLTASMPLLFCDLIAAYLVVVVMLAGEGISNWGDLSVFGDSDEARLIPGIFCAGCTLLILLFGGLAILVRWLVERLQRPLHARTDSDVLQGAHQPQLALDAPQESENAVS